MNCYIIKDLLPNYIDGLNREETNLEIQTHLEICAECRGVYEKMIAEISRQVNPDDINVNFIKKLKAKIIRKNIAVAIYACVIVIVIVGFVAYGFFREVPVHFNREHMRVEIIPRAVLMQWDEHGWLVTHGARILRYDTELREGEIAVDELALVHEGFAFRDFNVIGRNIYRNGERIRVVYFNYTQTPVVRFLQNRTNMNSRTTGTIFSSQLQGFYFGPQTIEIYYLPNLHNIIHTITEFCYFDGFRENGVPVWQGVVGG